MTCYSPLVRAVTEGGEVHFFHKAEDNEPRGAYVKMQTVPCNGCIGCRMRKQLDWTLRGLHELQTSDYKAAFVTLTYDDEHLPKDGCISKDHLQKFLKRLRRHMDIQNIDVQIRYFACGEYGEMSDRPHYHLIIYGYDFPDKQVYKQSVKGHKYYNSPLIAKAWKYGYNVVAEVTMETIAYTAKYVMKKITGEQADSHYARGAVDETTGEVQMLTPEFQLASRNPALGRAWFEKYKTDVFPSDEIVHEGRTFPVPAYYLRILEKINPAEYAEIKEQRTWNNDVRDTYKTLAELTRIQEVKQIKAEKILFEKDHAI